MHVSFTSTVLRRSTFAALLLLLIVYSRMLWIDSLEFHPDEIWAAWSAMGSLSETLARVPFDWPPLHALFMWVWQTLTGIHPITLRYGSLLLALIGFAFTFRLSLSLFGREDVAWMVLAVYAAFGYSLTLSLFVRGYVLMMPFLPLGLWLTVRYFRHFRWLDGLLVGVVMAVLFYINLTAVIAFTVFGLLSLAIRVRVLWRWWLPGSIALLLALPEIIDKWTLAGTRSVGAPNRPETLLAGLTYIASEFFGQYWLVWLALLISSVLLVLMLAYRRPAWRALTTVLFIWALLIPLFMYLLDAQIGFFSARHMLWVIPGCALLIGLWAIVLPRPLQVSAVLASVVLMFLTPPVPTTQAYIEPYEEFYPQLRERLQAGDVVFFDPDCECGSGMRRDYYQRVFFPYGLPIVDDPADHHRVWYISGINREQTPMLNRVEQGRVPSTFIGPPGLLMRLYEAPPDREGILFENGMRFHGVQVMDNSTPAQYPIVRPEGSTLTLRLWWSVDSVPAEDYSVGLFLQGDSGLIAQDDSAPQTIQVNPADPRTPPTATSQWQTDMVYIEERQIIIPNPTLSGNYPLSMAVYQWWDGQRFTAEVTDDDKLLPLLTVEVKSW